MKEEQRDNFLGISRRNDFPDTEEVILSLPHFKEQMEKKKFSVFLGGLADLRFWLRCDFNFPVTH